MRFGTESFAALTGDAAYRIHRFLPEHHLAPAS